MDAKEVAEWSAYDQIAPLTPERWDRLELMLGQLTAVFFNAHRGTKIREKQAIDFLPKRVWGTPSEGSDLKKTTPEEHLRKLGPLIALAAVQKEAKKRKAAREQKGRHGDSR